MARKILLAFAGLLFAGSALLLVTGSANAASITVTLSEDLGSPTTFTGIDVFNMSDITVRDFTVGGISPTTQPTLPLPGLLDCVSNVATTATGMHSFEQNRFGESVCQSGRFLMPP
jgi:hypothetical protein